MRKRENSGDNSDEVRVYLVGGGIASLSAAAFLIRDANVPGRSITVFEEREVFGGSLDGAGTPETGYVFRGGRMLENKYVCTYDLFSSIPTLDQEKTVTEEIFDWNRTMKTSSQSRLVRGGHRVVAPEFGLGEKHILTLERLALEPEAALGRSAIEDHFEGSFFATNFWLMWCTTFAFQPWHSAVEFRRYLLRFAHMVPGFTKLHGIMRTVYNQYDSLVRPLQKWLRKHGVRFEPDTRVTDLIMGVSAAGKKVDRIVCEHEGRKNDLPTGDKDYVIVTLGSMTEGSSLGSMDTTPVANTRYGGSSWELWEKIAAGRPEFGHPSVFASHVDKSKWMSFTTTLRDPALFDFVRDLTGNVPGEGGLITFADSSWLISIVLPCQPHFFGQPEDVNVFWGYGLFVEKQGDFVKKPMQACTGREILTELLGHLGMKEKMERILDTSICIPCMMPFITSQFMPRERGDRPQVLPDGWTNLGFVGQFCELPDDVVFTVEYSIRSAQTAVYKLFKLNREPPPVYKGQHNFRVLFDALMTLHDVSV